MKANNENKMFGQVKNYYIQMQSAVKEWKSKGYDDVQLETIK